MNNLELFSSINTFIFDVDGVLTNSELIITEKGELLRKMNTRDGYAIRHALNMGYKVAIITGGRSKGVIDRLKGLGISDVYAGIENKIEAFEDFLAIHQIEAETILYMGDDLPDYDVMKRVGMPTCPADAASEIIRISSYISDKKGGEGCARDVIERVLRLHGKWQ
jgi:3-deoxy-D-manno-octulosonate 8-phosphate phosphatase (KDO 8-P phosphatase)